eukprot:15366140-Ditylum_brightwellii.AAC.3
MLQQELTEMRATLQAMQQNNLQQQHSGQESQQYFYPVANVMMQQYPSMMPQYAPAWQHPFANLTNVNLQKYIGNKRKRKKISGRDNHNINSIQIKDSSSNLLNPAPIQRSIAGLMEHAGNWGQSVGIR